MSAIFKIRHETSYKFEMPVYLEPHRLLFYPAHNHEQQVREFTLKINPTPAGTAALLDSQDNRACLAWFNGQHSELDIVAESVVESQGGKAMDFLVYPFESMELGFNYDGITDFHLKPYLKSLSSHKAVISYTEQLRQQFGPGTISFLIESTGKIHKDIEKVNREEGHPLLPEETLKLSSGSCRDLVVLQMAIYRHLGLASRFVSGYLYHGIDEEAHELHAWTEVYIPGAGWLAFDPTIGLMVVADHIKVATGAVPEITLPVKGIYRGQARSTLETKVLIDKQN